MNVLIAIISDTFDRVWEQRQTYILSSQADILQDWLNVIPQESNQLRQQLYMYIVEPTFQQDNDGWEGKIQHIRKLLDRRFTEICRQGKEQMRNMRQQKLEQARQYELQRNETQMTQNLVANLYNQILKQDT